MLIIILFIIIAGVVSFVIPRFRDAYRELRSKLFVVERTKRQLYTYKNIYEQVIGTSGEEAARKILDVSRDNYRWAAKSYNEALEKPYNHTPGHLMGYRAVKEVI
ncbi:MAG: hypothetical protein RR225_09360 [Clostridium sp.]